ncbi:hypothetical protein CGRA01v4_11259 [Colletotrichum graminicola]|uniref:Uncharacterized protein n=1 Tax=Colletotrichum graminicola (strain M1.001 / M2 / FGSC 10212) TaxID=645133 RepID=E3QND6_COLGM|nr:uncharacterized protein GLRG_07518 [Colletotrichum graminicola M1.001]EFQ32374.1 hypothetical protein GLRG_07518 [Colletotrichum graminicola M1.001]WDK19972.1 hypothetical protein CGRA01v4_11259 [Colletotrichum graminicola]
MASLPSQHPSLALHLTDRALNPILTSARSQPQLEALSSLTTTALTAHAAANRFSLGPAQRIIVEHGPGSPVVLASFLNGADALPNGGEASAAAATANNRASSSAPSRLVSSGVAAGTTSTAVSSAAASARMGAIPDLGKSGEDSGSAAPMLVGVVAAATGEEAMEARRAAGRLERVGREFQYEWAAEEGAGDALGDGQ